MNQEKNEVKKPSSDLTRSTLFVRHIPPKTTDQELEAFFGEIGPLKACFIVKNSNAKSLCFSFTI